MKNHKSRRTKNHKSRRTKNHKSRRTKNHKSRRTKNHKSRRTKNHKSRRTKNEKIGKGGENNCLSYIISGAHGIILYDKSDMITIPDNIRLVVYSDFCGRSCSNIKTITNYICNEKVSSIKEIAYNIFGPQSIIPELYIIGDAIANIKLSTCNGDVIFSQEYDKSNVASNKFVPLSTILTKLDEHLKSLTEMKDTVINLHWIPCLEVYNKDLIKEKEEPDKIRTFLDKSNTEYNISDYAIFQKYKMNPCNESLLNIKKEEYNEETFSNCKILAMKNTVQIDFYDISDNNITITIKYPPALSNKYDGLPLLMGHISINKSNIKNALEKKINDANDISNIKLEYIFKDSELKIIDIKKITADKINKEIQNYTTHNIITDISTNITYSKNDNNNITILLDLSNMDLDKIMIGFYIKFEIVSAFFYFIYYSILHIPDILLTNKG